MLLLLLFSSCLMAVGVMNSADIGAFYRQRRLDMVEDQIALRGISMPEVLKAMRSVPRHKFVPEHLADLAYTDSPLPIGSGDGSLGWEEHAPYDAVIVTAAPREIPEPLKKQLREGGKMVIPVESDGQDLLLLTKMKDGLDEKRISPVRFVPMTGEAEKESENIG
ncbi:MAG: protein-L-isoaspartate O-methyltransferase [Thermodesulfobacteriota bacterium]